MKHLAFEWLEQFKSETGIFFYLSVYFLSKFFTEGNQ